MTRDPDSLRHLVSVISGGTYSLSLATVDPTQVLYNGKFSYLPNYQSRSGGWCHLLLLRSKNRYSKQLLAIITQTPDCPLSIVNTIENVATFMLNFFSRLYPPVLREDEDEDVTIIEMTPGNTIFVEYLPAGCFGPKSGHKTDTFGVMNFSWEKVPFGQRGSYYQATSPGPSESMWRHTHIDAINDLIARI